MAKLGRGQRLGIWSLRWVALVVLWLGLTDTRQPVELLAGAVVAAIGASFAGMLIRPGSPRTVSAVLALARLGPRRLGRPLGRLVPDTVLLAAALWRQLVQRRPARGSLRLARYRRQDALRSAAGRFATEAWGSLAPNRYVVGVDEEAGTILIHELVRSEAELEPLGRP